MARIYPVAVQLVESTLEKLVAAYPPVKDFLRLVKLMRDESNLYRYGTIKLALSGIIPAQSHLDFTGINIPGLRAGQELHMTPPQSFWDNLPDVTWSCMVITDSWAADQAAYNPTTSVTLRLHNYSSGIVDLTDEGLWQYLGVVSPSLNGIDPDTGQSVPETTFIS